MILGLDISTATGWALSDGRTGTLDLTPYKHDWRHMCFVFQNWLADQITERNVTTIIVEQPFHRGTYSTLFFWLEGQAHTTAYVRECESQSVPPSTVKFFATGNGRAKKPAMIAAAKALGWKVEDDHQADAALLIEWFHAQQREAAA